MVVMAPLKKVNNFKSNKKLQKQNNGGNENEANDEVEIEEVPKEIRFIAQEVKIVQNLANNNLVVRTRQMKKLKVWLNFRAKNQTLPFKEDDFMRIWKGLYYHFWLSDKPLVQEDLADDMSKLLSCFQGDIDLSVNFFGAFMKTMCQQWFGMDQWRMDKYMMLVRRMLRALFVILKETSWEKEAVDKFNNHMMETILDAETSALGLAMHYFDIFFEELAKVSNGDINEEDVFQFVKPFIKFLAYQTDFKLIEHCKKKVFFHLLFQSSLGREYQDKYTAWRQMGFPTKSIHDLEKVGDSKGEVDEEDEQEAEQNGHEEEESQDLDPRAGNVDVFIDELPLNGKLIIEELEALIKQYDLTTKRRKMLKKLLELFQKYDQGIFPLGVKTMPRYESKSDKPLIQDKIEKLENLENELFGVERKLKKLNKRKRRRLLKTLNFDNADEGNFDDIIDKALQKRKEIQMALMNDWTEEPLDDSDIPLKKAKEEDPEDSQESVEQIVSKKAKQKNKLAEEGQQNKKKKILNGLEAKKPAENEETPEGKASMKKKQKMAQKNVQKVPAKENKVSLKMTSDQKAKEESAGKLPEISSKEEPSSLGSSEEGSSQPKVEQKLPRVLKISTDDEEVTPKKSKKANTSITSEWDTPLNEGEVEFFIPSSKLRLKEINNQLNSSNMSTPVRKLQTSVNKTPGSSPKKVKIALKHNTSQNPSEYIKQVRSSPNVPYDASKKPAKGLLKPNVTPGPINPFYKKKIGLKLLNDTY